VTPFDLSRRLTRELGRDFVVVPRPDHPELSSGPDVLVGGRGRLTAVFRIGRTTASRLLDARVIAARLAFPAGTLLVAMVDDGATVTSPSAGQGFDEFLGSREVGALIRLCTTEQPRHHRAEELRRIQQKHATFYSTIFQIAELRGRHHLQPSKPREVIDALSTRMITSGPSRPLLHLPQLAAAYVDRALEESDSGKLRQRRSAPRSPRTTVRDTTVATLPGAKVKPTQESLRTLWSEALSEDFGMDAGVPYPRAFHPRILLVEVWPKHRFDPQKPVRIAAFSSWLLAISTTPEEIESLVDRSLEVIGKRMNA
jgi:hypothetical protein